MPASPGRPDLTVVVLAAGGGTRMRSKTVKVLHPLCGRTMLGHVLAAASGADADRLAVVVGTQREQVAPHVRELAPQALVAVQDVPRGTGDAVRVAVAELEAQRPLTGTVVVTAGDTPLLEAGSLRRLAAEHAASGCAVSILTGRLPDPTGYGRIVRAPSADGRPDAEGDVLAIVEQKDAGADQQRIDEVSSGILAFDAGFLRDALPRLTDDNAQGELYLTDTVALARADGLRVGAVRLDDVAQAEGANDRVQLAALAAEMNRRTLERWMREGVTVVDPATTWVDVDVRLAADVTLLPGTQLHGRTTVGEDAVVGPDTTLTDVEVGEAAQVVRTHAASSTIGPGATVGPYAHLRPGTVVGARGKVGGFVETKNAVLGEGAKVPHLSYVGDAEVGEGANIGAGTIVANYDGVAKHRTVVGRHARTGSNNTFVAPVRIGDGAVTGGGTVVRRDVPPGALAVSSPAERHLEGWVLRRRAGTDADRAAREAGAREPDEG